MLCAKGVAAVESCDTNIFFGKNLPEISHVHHCPPPAQPKGLFIRQSTFFDNFFYPINILKWQSKFVIYQQ